MAENGYDRTSAVAYARRWALGRNPAYFNFEDLGGDCTNFASQCIYAGAGVMNFMPVTGWYYVSASERSAAWTGVEYIYRFLVSNRGLGPWAVEVEREAAQPGDIVQLGDGEGHFYHSPVIVAAGREILVAAHSYDCLDRPLDSYDFRRLRFLHIAGVRRRRTRP